MIRNWHARHRDACTFQGTAQTQSTFGDGLRCVAGTVVRIAPKWNVVGASQYPDAGDAALSAKGLIGPDGGVRYYQIWYRNAAVFCTSSTFNLTNALQIIWVP